ncbi:MAG: ABC transporter ATP-binding protein [Eubacterium sp.]|nr:ABC transporter ATP-binding protein [Eubacterium sp.]
MVGEVLVDLIQPRLMETIVDEGILGINNGGVSDIPLIASTGIRMILIVIVGGGCGILSAVFTNLCAQNFGNDVRKACFSRIMQFSYEQTDHFTTGSLITRITSDVSQTQQMVSQMIRGFVRCMIFFAGGSFALVTLDMHFGVIVAIAVPLLLLDIIFVLWKTNPLFSVLQKRLDRMNTVIEENVSGARVVKAFVQEERETGRFADANQQLVDTQFRVLILMSYLRPIMNIVLNLAIVGILYVGGVQVQGGNIAPGAVMAAITYISQILNGMMMLAMIFQTLSRGSASVKRLKEVLDTEPALKDGPGVVEDAFVGAAMQQVGLEIAEVSDGQAATGTIGPRGLIEFRDVSFSYPGRKEEILRHIDLTIRPGETLGVIGATASGKSTLVSLIPRFYDVTSGEVLVDGVNVREYTLTQLREKVSYVLQKSELFGTTIRENIAIGKNGAEFEEIKRAAQAAQADDFIMQQPQQYDTPVAEAGMSLSGGQRQRVAISRALLKHAEILVFDDATSALDLKTEAKLYEALKTEYADVTKVIIAQRIASIRDADRIAVLNRGKIVGYGKHEELLIDCPVYKDIYDSQLKEKEVAS